MNWNKDFANYVDEKGVKEIEQLENKIGKWILAYPEPPEPGKLNEETRGEIESLEKKRCVRLVAYEKH
ncbi:MAG: hypothetical protein ACP5SH_11530 [Syntrophobacteraceae bacterium]